MSDSHRVMLRVTASMVLALALCLGLVLGVTGCGDDKDDAGDTTTTSAGAGDGTSATGGSGVGSQTDGVDSALLGKWYSEVCLLDQPFVKEDKQTIDDLRGALITKTGENVTISRFVRYELGEKA